MRFSSLLALASGVSATTYLGFNSGATTDDGTLKTKADFLAEFQTAGKLNGPAKFSAVRLYTNIQGSTGNPIEAFEAAMETNTHIMLGIWTSGTQTIQPELDALQKAVKQYGTKFTDLVIGISIGSEDLYRDSVTGQENGSDVGNSPDAILGFIDDFKKAMTSNPLGKIPVGHVDTWDVWPNSTVKPVIDAVDFIGVNEFPYYQTGQGNDIKNSGQLFEKAFNTVLSVAGDKPVWVTETGWPYVGIDWDEAKPSVDNAKYYWNEVGCRLLFNKVTTFWYTLADGNPANKQSFAIADKQSGKARFDLSCPTTFETPSGSSSSASGSPSSTASPSGSGTSSSFATPTPSGSGSSSNGTASGSGASPSGGASSGSGSGSGSSSGAASSSGAGTSPAATPPPEAGAAALGMFSVASYAALALAAGAFYLL